MITDFYSSFISKVAEARNKSIDEIQTVAQGRVWTGKDGLDHGLIDKFGGLDEAIELAKEMAGMDANKDPKLVFYPKSKSFLKSITRTLNIWENPVDKIEKYVMKMQIHPLSLMSYKIVYH